MRYFLKSIIFLVTSFSIGFCEENEGKKMVLQKLGKSPENVEIQGLTWGESKIFKVEKNDGEGAYGKQVTFCLFFKDKVMILNDFSGPNFHQLSFFEELGEADDDAQKKVVILTTYSSGGVGSLGWVTVESGRAYQSKYIIEGAESKFLKVIGIDDGGKQAVFLYKKKGLAKVFTVRSGSVDEVKNSFRKEGLSFAVWARPLND